MRKKWMVSLLMMFVLFFGFSSGQLASADDDDEYEHEYGEGKVEDHEWDDEDDDWEEEEDYEYEAPSQSSYWHMWTRDTSVAADSSLPFQEAQEVAVQLNKESEQLYVIPRNGQLLVSGEKMANLLQADYTYHKQSRILEVSKGRDELIVRSGSNAAYENLVKTPMPSEAYFFEKSVYLPVSVIANTFGYRVSWNEGSQTIVLQSI
ncbi:copper amine oxidase N-terminal domain-containing protein [Pseudobacillus badius]|uniref:copper amine oxidase N-terminal domain-containing protein n=1 Tax=Bacillus badius TaxID=1455 RepID=UPI0007B3CBA0|nr:copper amine oxidase N-terminal domain-containing protein [Bacillus badius]KZR59693.1 hypothetical protein A3781_11585 [Bacillus badius]